MSPTPPRASPRPSAKDAGEGATLDVVQARGAQRTGAIWILAISLSLAILALGAYWVIQAPRLQAVNHPSGRDLNLHDVRKLYPGPATRPADAGTTHSPGGA